MANLLDTETSPYLLQHKDNPVHWRPWGPEALAQAKTENKPILLSIGYAACHWCHVMAHESFEDDATAEVMNRLYVNIKVDREERPDIDQIYMEALLRMGDHGGWPLTMFLTPDGEPFWGGTYFPKQAGYGRPAFAQVLEELSKIFHQEPDRIAKRTEQVTTALHQSAATAPGGDIGPDDLDQAAAQVLSIMDPANGGIRGAPKFPQFFVLELLWRATKRTGDKTYKNAVLKTLSHICQGGIYDHLGGGMARYAVDEIWLVPHFEKMLYDNALLVKHLTWAWLETKNPLFKSRLEETVSWLKREMLTVDGGFSASLDADSEGEEGKFYVWTYDEILAALGAERGKQFCQTYGVLKAGNWEGVNVLNRLNALDPGHDDTENLLAAAREDLLKRRAARIRPGLDDKVLADWNGTMIAALANAARALDRPDWLALAETAFRFITESMADKDLLYHGLRLGRNTPNSTAADYANMTDAAIVLYETTGATGYLDHATTWTETMDRLFLADDGVGYYFSPVDAKDVLVRMRNVRDDATPNANVVMIANLARLHALTGTTQYRDRAGAIAGGFAAEAKRNVVFHSGLFNALEWLNDLTQIVVMAPDNTPDPAGELVAEIFAAGIPSRIVIYGSADKALPQTHPAHGKTAINDHVTVYVCKGETCSLPVTDNSALRDLLQASATGS
jgi:uncharacterized protein YyaL (SSP411 family)